MEATTTGEWILYAREKGTSKRFGAVNWRSGSIGVLRVHASHFTDAERASLEANDLAHPNNAWMEWEFRPAPPRMRIRTDA